MAPLPPCDPSSTLPSLIEELVDEILIRIPPDEPAHLFRAALVCKPWRGILSDRGFLRRYHAFHRRHPPLLGFFCNDCWSQRGQGGCIPCFKPAAGAFPSLSLPMRYWHRVFCVLDCRHGRVLLRDQLDENLFVWDPISDAWQELRVHDIDCEYTHFVVLCALAGCDHHDCRSGPFLVVSLGAATDNTIFRVLVYSSEARAWGTPVSSKLDGLRDIDIPCVCAAVIGDKIFHVFTPSVNIVKYDLVKRCISLLISSPSICSEGSRNSPPIGEHPVLTQNEDGSLGLASIGDDSRLYIRSSRMVNHDGKLVVEWVQERVIELDKILPIHMNKHCSQLYVAGFAEGARIFFISTYAGTFTFELESGRVTKITASREYTALISLH